jgi:branched-chain amino acid transport system permease protein
VSLPLYYYLAISAVYILMSWALYLPYRVAHLHFLTVANMAVSGYLAGYLVMSWQVPFGLALLLGFAAGGLLGWLVSLFIGDAPTFAVVIVGFTFIYITRTVIENTDAIGGTLGMFGLPAIWGAPGAHRWTILAILYGLLVLVGFLIHRFEHSRLGRAASAVFTDKDLAASFGVDIKKLGMLAQTFSSLLAGGCGVLYGWIYRSFHLDYFTFHLVGIFMTVIFVGGYATLWGSLLAAPVLYGIPLLFPTSIASWRIVIYGVMLIAVLVLKPEGFVTRRLVHRIENALSRRRKTPPGKENSKILLQKEEV